MLAAKKAVELAGDEAAVYHNMGIALQVWGRHKAVVTSGYLRR